MMEWSAGRSSSGASEGMGVHEPEPSAVPAEVREPDARAHGSC